MFRSYLIDKVDSLKVSQAIKQTQSSIEKTALNVKKYYGKVKFSDQATKFTDEMLKLAKAGPEQFEAKAKKANVDLSDEAKALAWVKKERFNILTKLNGYRRKIEQALNWQKDKQREEKKTQQEERKPVRQQVSGGTSFDFNSELTKLAREYASMRDRAVKTRQTQLQQALNQAGDNAKPELVKEITPYTKKTSLDAAIRLAEERGLDSLNMGDRAKLQEKSISPNKLRSVRGKLDAEIVEVLQRFISKAKSNLMSDLQIEDREFDHLLTRLVASAEFKVGKVVEYNFGAELDKLKAKYAQEYNTKIRPWLGSGGSGIEDVKIYNLLEEVDLPGNIYSRLLSEWKGVRDQAFSFYWQYLLDERKASMAILEKYFKAKVPNSIYHNLGESVQLRDDNKWAQSQVAKIKQILATFEAEVRKNLAGWESQTAKLKASILSGSKDKSKLKEFEEKEARKQEARKLAGSIESMYQKIGQWYFKAESFDPKLYNSLGTVYNNEVVPAAKRAEAAEEKANVDTLKAIHSKFEGWFKRFEKAVS